MFWRFLWSELLLLFDCEDSWKENSRFEFDKEVYIPCKTTLTGNITVHLTFFTNAEKKDLSYLITYIQGLFRWWKGFKSWMRTSPSRIDGHIARIRQTSASAQITGRTKLVKQARRLLYLWRMAARRPPPCNSKACDCIYSCSDQC